MNSPWSEVWYIRLLAGEEPNEERVGIVLKSVLEGFGWRERVVTAGN